MRHEHPLHDDDTVTTQGTLGRRLPSRITPSPASGSSLGPREKVVLGMALAAILVWGFSGGWELPKVEKTIAGESSPAAVALGTPGRSAERPAAAGEALFEANGCVACHSVTGERKIGPSLKGIFGEAVELSGGGRVTADHAYLVESILHPQAKIVDGFEDVAMPSYEGVVSPDDAEALAEYIRGLR